jgi:hypothetical protein
MSGGENKASESHMEISGDVLYADVTEGKADVSKLTNRPTS